LATIGYCNPLVRNAEKPAKSISEARRTERSHVYLGEFAIRVVLIFLVPVGWVLVISPVLLGSLTLVTIIWTFRYAKGARERAIPKIDQLMRREAE
jgi:hypothetical protein